uniref:Uncharacterized protein n=1 Tax=Salix viminalis TaxID=40686 RepID=A0A6N2K4A4_SALVM
MHGMDETSSRHAVLMSFLLREASTPSRLAILTVDLEPLGYCWLRFPSFSILPVRFVHPHCFHHKAAGLRSYANQIKKGGIRKPINRLDDHTFHRRRIQAPEEVIQLGYNVVYTVGLLIVLRTIACQVI